MTIPKPRVNFVIVGNTVTITYLGKSHTILPEHPNYMAVLKAIHTKKPEGIPKLLDLKQMLVEKSDGLLKIQKGILCLDGKPLPHALAKKVDTLMKGKQSWAPLKSFWKRLEKNPDNTVQKQLYGFLEHNGHPITSDGCFLAYKRVRSCLDGTFVDLYTGKVKYEIGKVTEMDRKNVNPNPNETCSAGLHAASYHYASQSYGNESNPLIELKIDPMHVCAVPTDYNAQKMRCCEVFIIGVSNGPRTVEFVNVEQKTKREKKQVQQGTLKPLSLAMVAALPKRDAKGRFIRSKIKVVRKSTK
jgi:hypothetical protein